MYFIDTHQHLILRDRLGYGWTAGIPALSSGEFGLAEYRAEAAGLAIGATLFMESGVDDADYQTEARLIASLIGSAEGAPVAQIASCRPETEAGFEAWLDECAALEVHGFRRILHVMPDELSQSEIFRRNLRRIGARGLSFDICVLARQLPIALNLARACPDQMLVLDHCGVPDIAGGGFDSWAEGILRLAELPHVVCKLSGLPSYCAPGADLDTVLRRWVDHILHHFGPHRIVWGSDWPVVRLGGGLPAWMASTQKLLSELSTDEKAAIASGAARRVYQL